MLKVEIITNENKKVSTLLACNFEPGKMKNSRKDKINETSINLNKKAI